MLSSVCSHGLPDVVLHLHSSSTRAVAWQGCSQMQQQPRWSTHLNDGAVASPSGGCRPHGDADHSRGLVVGRLGGRVGGASVVHHLKLHATSAGKEGAVSTGLRATAGLEVRRAAKKASDVLSSATNRGIIGGKCLHVSRATATVEVGHSSATVSSGGPHLCHEVASSNTKEGKASHDLDLWVGAWTLGSLVGLAV